MTWELLGGVLVGALIGEYYRRVNDKIRREQIRDLREDKACDGPRRAMRREEPEELYEAFGELDRPKRRRREPLIAPEQQAEYLATGATRGKRIHDAPAS